MCALPRREWLRPVQGARGSSRGAYGAAVTRPGQGGAQASCRGSLAIARSANVISTIVDVARLLVYFVGLTWLARHRDYAALGEWRTLWLVGIACIAGFLGSFLGARVLKKVTLRGIRILVAALLFVVAGALGAGII